MSLYSFEVYEALILESKPSRQRLSMMYFLKWRSLIPSLVHILTLMQKS